MTDDLLRTDIKAFLQAHALGRARAVPRQRLLAHLRDLGHSVNDRKLRRIYADMPQVGHSCTTPKGAFWIVTDEDRKAATKQLHAPAMKILVREKLIREAGPSVQGELF
jgi:hypothetical protein